MKSSFLIAGTKSGAGKTVITLGIMAALKERGLAVQPFKCGPDFIDPTLHKVVTGEISSNLDMRMCGRKYVKELFLKKVCESDVAVVEGVMGLFDGGDGSGATLAQELDLPVILIIDVRSAAESVAAVLYGFENLSENIRVQGVIFNFTGSDRHKEIILKAVTEHCNAKIIGFLPRDEKFIIPDRHLGLHMGDEVKKNIDFSLITKAIENHLDLDALLEISKNQQPLVPYIKEEVKSTENNQKEKVRLAVAKDEAFCFYYDENFEILRENAIEIVFFSPLHDDTLPVGIDGIYFGGGYPELHANQLSKNKNMLDAVNKFHYDNGVIYAECGGFMYLSKGIYDVAGSYFEMVDVFTFNVRMRKRFSRLGYREVRLKKDCIIGETGDLLYGHEFHYSDIDDSLSFVDTVYDINQQPEGYVKKNTLGSYVHLHFARSQKNINKLYRSLLNRKHSK